MFVCAYLPTMPISTRISSIPTSRSLALPVVWIDNNAFIRRYACSGTRPASSSALFHVVSLGNCASNWCVMWRFERLYSINTQTKFSWETDFSLLFVQVEKKDGKHPPVGIRPLLLYLFLCLYYLCLYWCRYQARKLESTPESKLE